jgi:hypothetical protein
MLKQLDALLFDTNSEWIPASALVKSFGPDADGTYDNAVQNLVALAKSEFIFSIVIDDAIGTELKMAPKGLQLIGLVHKLEHPDIQAKLRHDITLPVKKDSGQRVRI